MLKASDDTEKNTETKIHSVKRRIWCFTHRILTIIIINSLICMIFLVDSHFHWYMFVMCAPEIFLATWVSVCMNIVPIHIRYEPFIYHHSFVQPIMKALINLIKSLLCFTINPQLNRSSDISRIEILKWIEKGTQRKAWWFLL